MPKLIQLIEVTKTYGDDTPEDPKRGVTEYWFADGSEIAAVYDPLVHAQGMEALRKENAELREKINRAPEGQSLPEISPAKFRIWLMNSGLMAEGHDGLWWTRISVAGRKQLDKLYEGLRACFETEPSEHSKTCACNDCISEEANLNAIIAGLRHQLEKIKIHCLTTKAKSGPDLLSPIIRMCIDAGIKQSYDELERKHAESAQAADLAEMQKAGC